MEGVAFLFRRGRNLRTAAADAFRRCRIMNSWELISLVHQRVAEETGTLRTQAPFRIALCYPSEYSVGMSSLGFQTIYREIHLHPDTAAERAFLPDSPGDYRRLRVPVFTYESDTPIPNFPVIAFS